MRTRRFALIFGIVYLLVGLAGFVFTDEHVIADLTVHNGEGDLFGLFPVNVLHNLYHVAVGLLGILAYRSFDFARTYSRVLAAAFTVLTVMGLIDAGNLNHTFGLIPLNSHDIWLHAGTALLTGYFGFGPVDAAETSGEPGSTRRAV